MTMQNENYVYLHYLNSLQSDKILQNFAKVYNDICNRTLLLESHVS